MNPSDAIRKAVEWAGNQSRLGEMLGVAQGQISCWITRDGQIGPTYALKTHQITGGKVSAHDLRPDLYPKDAVTIKRIKKG